MPSEPGLRAGLIRLPSWHDHHQTPGLIQDFWAGFLPKRSSIQIPAIGRDLALSGVIALILVLVAGGLGTAGYLSSSISSDGVVLLRTTGEYQNGSYASSVLATEPGEVTREVSDGYEMQTALSVRGEGPVLFDEYMASILRFPDPGDLCRFLWPGPENEMSTEQYASGILDRGSYESIRTIGSEPVSVMGVNGSGMVSFGVFGYGNRTMTSRGFVAGNMTVHDITRFGGKI